MLFQETYKIHKMGKDHKNWVDRKRKERISSHPVSDCYGHYTDYVSYGKKGVKILMSQAENMALPIEGQISRSELLEIKNTMNTRALAKRRGRTALRLTANVLFAFVVLLPLLYAVSIAFMPSSELFTTELNILPQHPTWSNFYQCNLKCTASEILL